MGPAVDGLVARALEPLDEVVLEFVAGMVGTEVHAHGSECDTCAPGWLRRVSHRKDVTKTTEPQENLK
ncbi:hypothetical protein GCM10019016_051990 [Streptomyces prasinosporus]|uniref:Transposase n=1 Tax=Streptomyces prasinosporus TaxID=68256 RepID=A0ABP6TS04_9ACTN